MRPIHRAPRDKTMPVLVLTRDLVRAYLGQVTVAPITTTVRGLSTEVPVGPPNGLDAASVVSCDNIATIPVDRLGPLIGVLVAEQEASSTAAIQVAFDLDETY